MSEKEKQQEATGKPHEKDNQGKPSKPESKEKKLDEEAFEDPFKKGKSGKDKKTKEAKEQKEKISKKKEIKRDPNFRYIVRIANTDLSGEKTVEYGLTQIKGVGRHMSALIVEAAGIDKKLEVGNLNDQQIEQLKVVLENQITG